MSQRAPTHKHSAPFARPVSRRTLLAGGAAALPLAALGVVGGRALLERVTTTAAGQEASAGGEDMPSCIITPQQTEGPYFVDEQLIRADIRSDPSDGAIKDGAPLRLGFRLLDVTGGACAPLAGAMVDVWHCDALGVYSGVVDRGSSTVGQAFLRGAQLADANGAVEFLTIYPGWYQGRTVHIHFKVRTDPAGASGYEFTSQVYFDDALSDRVFVSAPYNAKGARGTRNANDGIYRDGGAQLLLPVVAEGDGYAAVMPVGVDMSAPASSGFGGPPPGGPGGRPPRP